MGGGYEQAGGWGRKAGPPRSGPAASKASVRAEPPVRGWRDRGRQGGGPVPKGLSPATVCALAHPASGPGGRRGHPRWCPEAHRVRRGVAGLWGERQKANPAGRPRRILRYIPALWRAPAREPPGNLSPGGQPRRWLGFLVVLLLPSWGSGGGAGATPSCARSRLSGDRSPGQSTLFSPTRIFPALACVFDPSRQALVPAPLGAFRPSSGPRQGKRGGHGLNLSELWRLRWGRFCAVGANHHDSFFNLLKRFTKVWSPFLLRLGETKRKRPHTTRSC